MRLKAQTKAMIYPEIIHQKCTKAEHTVAVQAERDSRRNIPSATGRLRRSGRVYGNIIAWDVPYARIQYFGNMYVDPKRKIAGFPTAEGWRSFSGVKKVRSDRKFQHTNGGTLWFTNTKKRKMQDWCRLAKGVIERG